MKFLQIFADHKKIILFILSGCFLLFLFVVFSYFVNKGILRSFDFDTTIRIQNHIPRRLDSLQSFFSLLGSAEITTFILFVFTVGFAVVKKQIFIGFIFFFIAVFFEVVGKTYVINPAPPFFLLRNNLGISFPSFYIHTNYSYPSGHMTRTAFLVVILLFFIFNSNLSKTNKYIYGIGTLLIGVIMFVSRICLGEHWFSDVFGGSILGIAFALISLFFWQIQIKLFPQKKQTLTVPPETSRRKPTS